jgi:nitronate monooxygenase
LYQTKKNTRLLFAQKSLMQIETSFTRSLGIKHPLLMAPMFLVSNEAMMKEAILAGIAGCFPSLNYRNEQELDSLLKRLNSFMSSNSSMKGSYGVNLIVQKTNPLYEKHLRICVENKVPFYITSLGNPKEVIEQGHAYGAKVYCDVTNLEHAQKCSDLKADGFVAVGQGAGGHAGPFPLSVLIPALKKNFPGMSVIAAGGIAEGNAMLSMFAAGADAVSVGTRFIASTEADVSEEYKAAIVSAGMNDIVFTTRLSGTPCNIINTPYARKIGFSQNAFEKFLSRNPRTKKYFKMLVQLRGMDQLEKSVKPGSYKNLWCAGQSVEMIGNVIPCSEIISGLLAQTETAYESLKNKIA